MQGRLLVGQFREMRGVKRKDGSVVDGFFEIVLTEETYDDVVPMRASFFGLNYGAPSKIMESIESLALQNGDWVAVRISTAATIWTNEQGEKRAFYNDTALSVELLSRAAEGAGRNVATQPVAVGNGKRQAS